MARETRALRPFDALDRTQSALRESLQLTGSDPELHAAYPGQSLVVDPPEEYSQIPVTLWFDRNKDDHDELAREIVEEIHELFPAPVGVVHLVVSLGNKRLKTTEIVHNAPILTAADIPFHLELHTLGQRDGRPLALQTAGDGCAVLVEFLLGSEVPEAQRRPARAWRKGSWLARATLRLTTSGNRTGPRPLPLTSEVREALGLPDGVSTFVLLKRTGPELLESETFDEVMEFYVDADLLGAVMGDPLATWSQRHQLGWILEAISTFVWAISGLDEVDDVRLGDEPWNRSLLLAVLEKATESPKVKDLEDALEVLKAEPWRLLALLQDTADICRLDHHLLESLGEERS